MKKKQKIMIGIIAALLTALVAIILIPKPQSTQGVISGYDVRINKKVEITHTDGIDYLIIPVNTDMSGALVTSIPEGLGLKPLSDYLSELETTYPKEIEYQSVGDDIQMNLHIIISDDLR